MAIGAQRALASAATVARRLAEDLLGHSARRRWASMISLLVLAGTIGTWLMLIWASEEFVPATLLAYGPRFVVLVPIVLGALLSLVFARASLALYAVCALIAVGPIMGGRFHPIAGRGPIPASPTDAQSLRVMTLNAQGGNIAAQYLPSALTALAPGLVDIQECGEQLVAALASLPGWHRARFANLCVLSRWPLIETDSMPRAAFARVATLGYGGTALVVRFRVAHPTRPFDFITLHLETPRKGIEKLMGNEGFIPDADGGTATRDLGGERINARIRSMESERASVWASRFEARVPVIIAGDFNMPVESSIYRKYWSRFANAFEETGMGFGYTKRENRYIQARIDHVLFAPEWFEASGSWVGPEVGSDHRPVVADLRFRR